MSADPTAEMTRVELLKIESRELRGELAAELADATAGKLTSSSEQLIKFHGMYEQRDRDRSAGPGSGTSGDPPAHSLMVRGRIPGGRLSAEQWLAWDTIADRFGAYGLRITTRQGLQLHGVVRQQAKAAVKAIHEALGTTSGACGDVVRNITQAVNPSGDPRLAQLDRVADLLSSHFRIRSRAYAEIFLDDELQNPETEGEILYGKSYLPRKFKIAVTSAGNNSIDIFAQDLGFAATFGNEIIDGFLIFAGGGMGMTHHREETFPWLADYLGWIPEKALLAVAEAAVTTQRDFGDRQERRHARLKYTIHDRGLEWFRDEVTRRSGTSFEMRPVPAWSTPSYLGWQERGDGRLSLGFHTLSGRVADLPGKPIKSILRELIGRYRPQIQLTPEEDLILLGIDPVHREEIDRRLREVGLHPESVSRLYARALACVALPTCGKALAEGERAAPDLLGVIQKLVEKYGLEGRAPLVRITGCPNGCARPYTAEIGLVGEQPGKYALYLGGHPEGTRLAFHAMEKLAAGDLPAVIEALFVLWVTAGGCKERLGDFVSRFPRAELLASLTRAVGQGRPSPLCAVGVNDRLTKASPQEILGWAIAQFAPRLALSSAFGIESVALIDMLARERRVVEIFYLDTGRLHQETYATIERIRRRYQIPIRAYFPDAADLEKLLAEGGPNGFYESVAARHACCEIRKVRPLQRALKGKLAWITGLRKEQSVTRGGLEVVEWDDVNGGLFKINPLAEWSTEEVWEYVRKNVVPYNPLHDEGFPSIGCVPCTRAIQPGEDLRAGRWWWESPDHKECGLHRRPGGTKA